MDLRHLEQIVAICRAGSFSGAAKALGIAQPTLSKSIGRLEAKLGIQLFERTNSSARPTTFGKFVADQAATLLQNVATLGHELEQMAKGEAGMLKIGVGPATRLHPLPKVLRNAAQAFPRLQFVTRYAGPNLMMRALRAGTFDLVFCNHQLATSQDDFIRVKVFEDRYIVVARPDHPALKHAPLSAADIALLSLASAGLTPDFRAWLDVSGDQQRQNLESFLSDDYDLIKRMALESHHVARGPRFVFEQEIARGELVELPLDADFRYECWMLTTSANWRSPIVKAVAGFARD
ncbi:LysR family transcriptional regulator [Bradyrhizobium sp. CER78]|uniref:LysR family transcriptional regulator n=1 Tax=Bradyrhizobium sp. CER78 TaxID=3039162 RepID=UPI00244B816D|nr:LysR family transcriptional regulator [Bradyrhizobium sp. CER78]MDH2386792.1 LysR family transcriptional regulator [Bradyrhizobium sp. CER78]